MMIEQIINSYSNKSHISIRKIKEEYNKTAGQKNLKTIGTTQIYRIIKNKLNLSYRKTLIKNSKLLSKEFIKYAIIF